MWHWKDGMGHIRYVQEMETGGYRIMRKAGDIELPCVEPPLKKLFMTRLNAQSELEIYAVTHHWKQVMEEDRNGTAY